MSIAKQIAKHFHDVFFGGNWTSVNLKETLSDLTFAEAIMERPGFHSIARLLFHINYYVGGVLEVLNGGELGISDKYSFDLPAISTEQDWNSLVHRTLDNAEKFTQLVEKLEDPFLNKDFTDAKYGNYYRNLHGLVEHTHYHLGQIVILKKLARVKMADHKISI